MPAPVPEGVAPSPLRTATRQIDVPTAVFTWVAAWILGQILYLVVLGVSGVENSDDLTLPQLFLAVAATWLAYIAGLAVASERAGTGSFVTDYGLRFQPVDAIGLGIGALAQLVLVPLVYVPLEAWWPDTFSKDRLTETAEELTDKAAGWQVGLLVLMIVVGAPLVEELVYRGLLQRALAARFSPVIAWVVVAAWFAVIHFRPVEYPGLFAFGLVVGACVLATDRLGLAIACHVGFNAVGLLMTR